MTPSEFKRTYYPAIERVCAGTGLNPLFVAAQAALETGCIVTSEEHSIIGGLGGAVAEVVTETCPVPVLRVGVKDIFGRSGDPYALLERYELTAKDVAAAARRAVAMKK